ncbi:hypothetical protein [Rhodococcus erythropolis]|uniref:hypothetical protein n=1 Tax=Rhodococcus erythropolis TaxID=1833 RepID=UPI001292812D|nr:hypothetical protein [Rhodococcus erythropolis]MCW2298416.1 hypothetical protein [Rhodococcus erythropolis]MQP36046.1 hypothetical protein [Rhodococcus erythropolis]
MSDIRVYLPDGIDLDAVQSVVNRMADDTPIVYTIDRHASEYNGYSVAIDLYWKDCPTEDVKLLLARATILRDLLTSKLGIETETEHEVIGRQGEERSARAATVPEISTKRRPGSNKFLTDYPLKDVTVGRRFGGRPEGSGRWQRIPNLGVLWTDDKESLQLGWLDDSDRPAANALAWRLIHMALDHMTATDAFDLAARENPQYPIAHGDLADRGEDNFWN